MITVEKSFKLNLLTIFDFLKKGFQSRHFVPIPMKKTFILSFFVCEVLLSSLWL